MKKTLAVTLLLALTGCGGSDTSVAEPTGTTDTAPVKIVEAEWFDGTVTR